MKYPEKLQTIEIFKESTYKEKGSVFIAQVHPADTAEGVMQILKDAKKKFYDASHHCYAYSLIDGTTKYSDAGEPTGTAGIRILDAITHFGLINQLVIVIRYFGGTKLGVGRLGKAYYTATHKVLNESTIKAKVPHKKISIKSNFNDVNHVHRILAQYDIKTDKPNYSDSVEFNCLINPSKLNFIKKTLSELSKGRIEFSEMEEIIYL
jgi:uncharacterized YigZ family protein